jgi:hypothetical protein
MFFFLSPFKKKLCFIILLFKNGKNSILERSYYSSGFKIFLKYQKMRKKQKSSIYRRKKGA